VASRRHEPRWLSRTVIDAVHADQIRQHGGLAGIRDENALESALARPRQQWSYRREVDLSALAAAYGFALVRNHPYRDGNKRAGFLALTTFLGINGYELHTTDEDVVVTIIALADGTLSETQLAEWVRARLRHDSNRE
jgi:death-on-curing protein